MRKCPKCSSYNVEPYMFQSIEIIKCNSCGFDEGSAYDSNWRKQKGGQVKIAIIK